MKRKKGKKGRIVLATVALGIGAFYLYQPQRLNFFPRPAPSPNPLVDPDSSFLFSHGARVAVVAAHPDDPEFFIGGFLTKLHEAGASIAIIMATDGDKGYYPPGMTNPDENRRVRREEQTEAAKQYNAKVYFLGGPDGRLNDTPQLEESILERLRDFQPDYIVSFDPDFPPRVQHRDHLTVGEATQKVAFRVENARWHLRFSTYAANHFVDITSLWPTKRHLLSLHKSQFADRMAFIERLVGDRARADGKLAGCQYAEGLRVSRLR